MKTPEITSEFIKAVQQSIIALHNDAGHLQRNPRFTENSEVGELIREAEQIKYQHADLLKGWLGRIKED